VTVTAYIGFGSNLGSRQSSCRAALSYLLEGGEVRFGLGSALYETAPQGPVAEQPDFINAVARVHTLLGASDLLDLMLDVEVLLGRERGAPGGPRTIDLDLLLYGDAVLRTPKLSVPHPRLGERRFVLLPLLEIAPDLRHPASREPLSAVLERAPMARVVPLAGQRLEPPL